MDIPSRGIRVWPSRISHRLSLFAVALFLACASAQLVADRPLFAFQSNFWLNLHHFLRAAGRGLPVQVAMSESDLATWERTVALYRASYSQRDLLRDEGMLAIKTALVNAEGKTSLEGVAIDPELRQALEEVAPVYRRYFWAAHDASNRAWIANVEDLLREHGAKIAPAVAAAYGETWPRDPIAVDLTVSAGPVGAYTTYPPHVTIDSLGHPGNHGLASLELLFHEGSHQWGRPLSQFIDESAAARGKKVPRNLWHAVLFYNAGEITRRVLAGAGIDYVEYGAKEDIYANLCGAGCRDQVAAAWDAHLDGSVSIQEALDRLVADLEWTPSGGSGGAPQGQESSRQRQPSAMT